MARSYSMRSSTLQGALSKRQSGPLRSGECGEWVKVKTPGGCEANRERWRPFEENKAGAERGGHQP